MDILKNEINTIGIILVSMLVDDISFPYWSEKKVNE